MTTMDWLTILIAAAGGLGGAGLAHGMAKGQIAALREECKSLRADLRDMKAENKQDLRELRNRQDKAINGNGKNGEH